MAKERSDQTEFELIPLTAFIGTTKPLQIQHS